MSSAALANSSNGEKSNAARKKTSVVADYASDISSEVFSGPEDGECGDDSGGEDSKRRRSLGHRSRTPPRPRLPARPQVKPQRQPHSPIQSPEVSDIESEDEVDNHLNRRTPSPPPPVSRNPLEDLRTESVSPIPFENSKPSRKPKKSKKDKRDKKKKRKYRKQHNRNSDENLGSPVSSDPDLEVDNRPKAHNRFVPPLEGSPISSPEDNRPAPGWPRDRNNGRRSRSLSPMSPPHPARPTSRRRPPHTPPGPPSPSPRTRNSISPGTPEYSRDSAAAGARTPVYDRRRPPSPPQPYPGDRPPSPPYPSSAMPSGPRTPPMPPSGGPRTPPSPGADSPGGYRGGSPWQSFARHGWFAERTEPSHPRP